MHARLRDDARWLTLTACGGQAFYRHSWTFVPMQFEDEARTHNMLDVTDSLVEVDAFVLDEEADAPALLSLDGLTDDELRAMAKAEGIAGWHVMKRETLLARLTADEEE